MQVDHESKNDKERRFSLTHFLLHCALTLVPFLLGPFVPNGGKIMIVSMGVFYAVGIAGSAYLFRVSKFRIWATWLLALYGLGGTWLLVLEVYGLLRGWF